MLFHVFNIDHKSETEVYLYGKEHGIEGGIITIRITNIISPVYFLPSRGKEDLLMKELKSFTNEIKEIQMVKRTNIFNNSIDRNLNIFRVTLKAPTNFNEFESEYCEMLQTEFPNAVENFIISKGIMGPGLIQIDNLQKNTAEFNNVTFVRNAPFPTLKISSITVESNNNLITEFVYYSDTSKVFFKATLSKTASSSFKIFSNSKDLNAYLNEIIRKDSPDVVVVHNFHLKSKLNIRDKIFCDIFSFANGNIKGKDYSIQEICTLYKINKGKGLEGDAVALISIFNSMNALCLAKEMAEISGYILNRCLSNCRAERIEFTLLHDLFLKDYLFPSDKPKPDVKYAGGLVLEPVQGFYEDIILLLDFNSLYPSIIQEFNVCFSTIGSSNFYLTENNTDSILKDPSILSSVNDIHQEETFLPKILRNLVKRRRAVKELIKNCKCPIERASLDIRQQALKLTANSIYGCLGFTGSRFCNFEMAAFITAKGREILGETKILAESLNMKVIYGDTDSIMIHTKFPGSLIYYDQSIESAKALVKKINSKFQNIEIELEKAFKKLLLYTKKKYAALVFDKNTSYIETKGIDLVRRDFCPASSELSRLVLNIILDDQENKNEPKFISNNTVQTAEKIYSACLNFYNSLFNRPISDFVITCGLSKDISMYSKGSNLPHVNLALRLKESKGIIYLQDDVIPYVIGEGEGQISNRSYHPDENPVVDYQFYIKMQILPPLFRLISLISIVQSQKISLIFNIKDFKSKIISSNLSFIMPCCENIQEYAKVCSKCGFSVPDSFYIEKIVSFINEGIEKLYKEKPICNECGNEYLNHLTVCFYCNKELDFNFKNQEFNNLIESIESSFKNADIPEIHNIIVNYSAVSTYRTIDMRKYFSNEIMNFENSCMLVEQRKRI